MTRAMRPSTLETLRLGGVLDIFRQGRLPVQVSDAVDEVFGPAAKRGALVISGANGIVGAGKTMQLGARLQPFGVPVVALDFPGAPDGIGKQYPGLVRAFGKERAAEIMANTIRLNYDGRSLPSLLGDLRPRFLLEAIPEILDIKRAHYEVFRAAFPDIEIRSVTSGFPQSALGVGIAHPAFPHEINKVYEVVEPETSAVTRLLWALGLMPVPVSDHWSFVLDVLFCGLTLASLRFCAASNMPYWKADKYVRRLVGPNPFRAHDAIGAAGANFLTWSCLHHLSQHYGAVFEPAAALVEHKESGKDWYPPNHFRPLVNWAMQADEEDTFRTWILGPLYQMTSLMLHENRSHLSQMNAIGELCAQFSRGILAWARAAGADGVGRVVSDYHDLHPQAAKSAWYPRAFDAMDAPEWQQLYVNAEHDGQVGVISIGRESYNHDVDAELNRAIDWLQSQKIDRVIVTGDYHLSTQMTGADTRDFFPALEESARGVEIATTWSRTARRLHTDFGTSVGFVNGKRCLGGFLELLSHCHYLVAEENADLGFPEVTLPVVPGMEGCHWPFRKTSRETWPKLFGMLLEGRSVKARDAVGWLVDFAGSLEEGIRVAWETASGKGALRKRDLVEGGIDGVEAAASGVKEAASSGMAAGRKAILASVRQSCGATLTEALEIQARHSGQFMTTEECRRGVIGTLYQKTMQV